MAGAAGAGLRRVVAASVTSRFCLPEQGMTHFDVLSRASTFAVDVSRSRLGGTGLLFLTSAHVVHPFAFRHLYPGDENAWLDFVEERHVRASLEVRDPDCGHVVAELPFAQSVLRHPTRDLCALRVEDEALMEDTLMSAGVELQPLELAAAATGEVELRPDQQLTFHGHVLVPRVDDETGDDTSLQLPSTASGSFHVSNGPQTFCSTSRILEMGMCGGPVIDDASGECVGVVEGIVPGDLGDDHPAASVRGDAAIVVANIVHEFVEQVAKQGS